MNVKQLTEFKEKMKQAYKLQDFVFLKNLEPSNRKIQQKKQNERPSFLSLIPSPKKIISKDL